MMPMSWAISSCVAWPVRSVSSAMRCLSMMDTACSLRLVKDRKPERTKDRGSAKMRLGRYFLVRFFTTSLAS